MYSIEDLSNEFQKTINIWLKVNAFGKHSMVVGFVRGKKLEILSINGKVIKIKPFGMLHG